jgi:hypothetical protein
MIDAAAFAVTADLLAVVADLPAAMARHAELAKLTARADVAESALASRQQNLDQHQASARAELTKLKSAVAARREITECAEASVASKEATILESEEQWRGLGLPQEVPNRLN